MENSEATAAEHLKSLKRQRQITKGKFTRLVNACNDPDASIADKRVRAVRADELLREFELVQDQIEELSPDVDLIDQERHRAEVEDKHLTVKSSSMDAVIAAHQATPSSHQDSNSDFAGAVQTLIEHQSSMSTLIQALAGTSISQGSPAKSSETQQSATRCELRLPRVQIQEFDGQPLNWLRFRDLFESMVHAHDKISNAESLEYLLTKLKGDALSLIRHLSPTNGNYIIAWDLLRDKYDNSEKIRQVYLTLLLEQQPVRSESMAELRRFYNGVNESYNALKVLEEPVESWNSILIFMLEKVGRKFGVALVSREE